MDRVLKKQEYFEYYEQYSNRILMVRETIEKYFFNFKR